MLKNKMKIIVENRELQKVAYILKIKTTELLENKGVLTISACLVTYWIQKKK